MSTGAQAAFFLITTIASVDAQRDAASAQRRAQKARQNVQRRKNFRRKQQELRRARAARAQAVAQGVSSGAAISGTSAVGGTTGSIQSQAASNISFLDELNRAGSTITDAQAEATREESQANLFGTLASSTSEVGTIFQGLDADG